MAPNAPRAQRRAEALTRQRIVEAATAILDAGGEKALTLRALSTHLSTGHGAIYHHVADMGEVLATATDEVVARAVADAVHSGDRADEDGAGAAPERVLRALAHGLFDAIDAHPWVGAQIARAPWQPAVTDVYETVGEQLHAFGVPERSLSGCAGALVDYILGVAGRNAAHARVHADRATGRTAALAAIADRWTRLDPARYPRLHHAAAHLADHDDREQFLVGVDLILTGIATTYRGPGAATGPV